MTTMSEFGRAIVEHVERYDHAEVEIFGRKCEFTQEDRDRLLADQVRRLIGELA